MRLCMKTSNVALLSLKCERWSVCSHDKKRLKGPVGKYKFACLRRQRQFALADQRQPFVRQDFFTFLACRAVSSREVILGRSCLRVVPREIGEYSQSVMGQTRANLRLTTVVRKR